MVQQTTQIIYRKIKKSGHPVVAAMLDFFIHVPVWLNIRILPQNLCI